MIPEPTALILSGPPGVGKTTVAAILAERFERAVHLEADRFFSFLRSGFIEPWDPRSEEQNQMVMRIVASAEQAADAVEERRAAGALRLIDG